MHTHIRKQHNHRIENPLILHASAVSRALKYIILYNTIIIRRIEFKLKTRYCRVNTYIRLLHSSFPT